MIYCLTKSKYLNGLQCYKRLWYKKNQPERAAATSRSQRRLLDQNREIRQRARCQFPEGRLIDTTDPWEAAEQTKEAVRCGIPYIFEASFIFNDIWVRCDILEKDSNSWKIIEVKASNKVKKNICLT